MVRFVFYTNYLIQIPPRNKPFETKGCFCALCQVLALCQICNKCATFRQNVNKEEVEHSRTIRVLQFAINV